MTNTLFFHQIVRDATDDDESVSTSTELEDEQVKVEAASSSSLCSAIRKACLGCTKPPIQLLQELDSTTSARKGCLSCKKPLGLLQELVSTTSAAAWSPPISDQGPRDTGSRRKEFFYATPQSTILRSFDFKELQKATDNFNLVNLLGQGGFGPVFKGWINTKKLTSVMPGIGVPVAVKRLNLKGSEGYREWLTEAKYLGKLRHPNLVTLLGYACYDEDRLLVYEFVPQGSLENHLFSRGCRCHFSWRLRMKVAVEAAKVLAYLHSAETIHQDFTTSNILLDSNYNVKLSDFGFARDIVTDEMCSEFTRMGGTYGFTDEMGLNFTIMKRTRGDKPEYDCTGFPSPMSDVFSFGVVLLELLSGQRVLDKDRPSSGRSQYLARWIKPYLNNENDTISLLDYHLEGYSLGSAEKAIKLAFQCVSAIPMSRPSMHQVVLTLKQLQEHL